MPATIGEARFRGCTLLAGSKSLTFARNAAAAACSANRLSSALAVHEAGGAASAKIVGMCRLLIALTSVSAD